jgi:choline dehydrogenase
VLANRLDEDASTSILLLEAGPMDRDVMIHVPAGVYRTWCDPKLNWNYHTEPEPEVCERSIFMPRGKVVDGSSSINSMVYMRGHPLDYDRWASELGLSDWTYYDRCLAYFKAGESYDRGGDEWRGDNGPLGVSRGSLDSPLFDAFLEAGAQAGQGQSADVNGYNPEGMAHLDATKRHGRRCSAAVAHLKPALKRGNVTLLESTLVQRVEIDRGRATGILFQRYGQTHMVKATPDIILSGGAINSPQLLMLSGIGAADQLARHDIAPAVNLPGVGRNLQDHASILLQFACTRRLPIHTVDQPLHKAAASLRWALKRSGLAASNIWEAGGLIRSNHHVAYPNLQYHFGPVVFEYHDNSIRLLQAFALHVDQLRPRSRGQIMLASANPVDKPLLNFGYLIDKHDLDELVEGVYRARELVAQRAFEPWRGAELMPGSQVRTESDIGDWVRANVTADFHPCGTCRMGHGPDCVVDDQFRIYGVQGLRVVDASVIPQIPSCNLNAPTQMIAARAADYIADRPQRPPLQARFAFQG